VRVLITGANGRLGRRLIERLAPVASVRAVVRSAAARDSLADLVRGDPLDVHVLDYADADALAQAAEDCTHAVHLVGIINESRTSTFADAHERATAALVAAAERTGIERLLYLSIAGADPAHRNPCLASKGRAEQLLLGSHVPSLVLRVPMVLGEGDPSTRALAARARSQIVVLLRGASFEQPIYANDVIEGLVNALDADTGTGALDIAGPESLQRSALVRRAAQVLGRDPVIISLPLGVGLAAAWIAEKLSRSPPVSRAMLGVLDHDDAVDPAPAAARLRIALTPLDTLLERCLGSVVSRTE
jgi:NADH dehydrogenase